MWRRDGHKIQTRGRRHNRSVVAVNKEVADDGCWLEVRKLIVGSSIVLPLDINRIELDRHITKQGELVVRAILKIATKSEEVFDFPENFLVRWGRRWQEFKEQKFPPWLKKHYPIITNRVWAISKMPEINIPWGMPPSEFIHFRVVKQKAQSVT